MTTRVCAGPVTVAPYHVHLIALGGGGQQVTESADRVYQALLDAGVEVLYDDRTARPGEQFADADLIGLPLRLTTSARTLAAGGIEIRRRGQDECRVVPQKDVVEQVQREIAHLLVAVEERVIPVDFG